MTSSLRLAVVASLVAHGAAAWVLPHGPAEQGVPPVLVAQLRTGQPVAVPAPQPEPPKPVAHPAVSHAPQRHPEPVHRPVPLAVQSTSSPVNAPVAAPTAGPAEPVAVAAPPSGAVAKGNTNLPVEPPRYDAAYLANPPPVYPALARRRGSEGKVILEAHINTAGIPFDVKVITSAGDASLDEAALNAVWHWRFIPAKRGDQPVEAWVRVPLVFRLD